MTQTEPGSGSDPRGGRDLVPTSRLARRRVGLLLLVTDVVVLGALAAVLAPRLDGASLWLGAALPASAVAAFALFGLYGEKNLRVSSVDEMRPVVAALVLQSLAFILAVLLSQPAMTGRTEALGVLVWLPSAALLTLLAHSLVRALAQHRWPERLLVVGAGEVGQELARRLQQTRRGRVVGFVDDEPLDLPPELCDVPVFGEDDLLLAVASTGATRIGLAFSRTPAHTILERLRHAPGGPLPIAIVPRYFEITPSHATLSEVDGLPLLNIASAELSRGARVLKRSLDLFVGAIALVLALPLILAIALAIKLDSRGPVFYRQERLGYRRRPFRMWKFRTMRQGADAVRLDIGHLNEMQGAGPLFKMRKDPRTTRVGRVLRRTSLDELPQLLNVLGGSMSLVGPRPFVTHEAEQITGWGAHRANLVPGITGPWQVRGRNDVPYEEMLRLDYMYVANWCVAWDLRLLVSTVPVVLKGKGAS